MLASFYSMAKLNWLAEIMVIRCRSPLVLGIDTVLVGKTAIVVVIAGVVTSSIEKMVAQVFHKL